MILPDTKIFSQFVRTYLKKEVSPVEDPDAALMKYWETERKFFDTIEREEIEKQIQEGFNGADHLIEFAMSKLQSRRSRAGQAFENHLESLFKANNVYYSRGAVTKNNNKPDFVFPAIGAYHDEAFQPDYLTMLGLKTTAKDRWRQVLPEAEKVKSKHLATLEPSISSKQTDQMQNRKLTLVVPTEIKATYQPEQHPVLMTLAEFIALVQERQQKSTFKPEHYPATEKKKLPSKKH